MKANAGNEYLRTKVLTASPEQLQLMLHDGAVRFARQGRDALAAGLLEAGCEKLVRAQKIVLEMNASLRYDVDAALCQRIAALYTYIYRRLVDANLRHELEAADEAIELLEYQRQTWVMLMDRLARGRGGEAPAPGRPPAADRRQEQGESVPVSVNVAV